MERLIHVLLFSGLCLLTQATSSQYVLIQEKKTWHEAQAFCRQNHIDLATFQSTEDWTNVQKTIESSLNSKTWIGIYNDINSWRWSYREENITFKLWATGEPTNGKEECTVLEIGKWMDYPCEYKLRFVCYNEIGTNKFIYISHLLTTWREARSYCRQHYTDLAIIQSPSENDQLTSMTQGRTAWVGLYRDSWMWSDGSKVNTSSINWLTGKPDITGLNQPCGAIRADGLVEDGLCSHVLPFICLTYSRKQIVRVEVKSGENLNDPVVMEAILQLLAICLRSVCVCACAQKSAEKVPNPLVLSLSFPGGCHLPSITLLFLEEHLSCCNYEAGMAILFLKSFCSWRV